MRTNLVSIATDTTPLDGALYEPEGRPVTGAVLLFHGNTMNFYTGAPRFLPPLLTELGLVVSRLIDAGMTFWPYAIAAPPRVVPCSARTRPSKTTVLPPLGLRRAVNLIQW